MNAPRLLADPLYAVAIDTLRDHAGLAPRSLEAYALDLRQFARHLRTAGKSLGTATTEDVTGWLDGLAAQGRPLRSRARKLGALRAAYRALRTHGHHTGDPVLAVRPLAVPRELARRPVSPPLTAADGAALLATPGYGTARTHRDNAILRVLLATGLHIDALAQLPLTALDLETSRLRAVIVRGEAQDLPLDAATTRALGLYLCAVRPQWATPADRVLFVTQRGTALTRQALWEMIARRGKQAGLSRPICPRDLQRLAPQPRHGP